MTDPEEPDHDLDNSALDRALDGGFDAAGADANREEPGPAPSVIQRIGEITGQKPSVSLREVDATGHTPVLKPLTTSDGIAQQTGKYMVQGLLGQGGVGTVHKGHDTDLGRDVAIKFLHERYRDEPAILHRFVEEAQIGGQLQHPGIVPVHELGMSDGRPFFTMKMVKGQTLAQALSERKSAASDRRRFLAIFEQVCQTMAYAHARGVVHRDLKPANIMIGSFGEVQVVDWGMGKVLERGGVADEKRAAELQSQLSVIETVRSAGHGTQSIMGSVMGTPAYMPPEQARGDVDAMDARSDVFALGAILCEILTGQPPYVGEPGELLSMAAMAKLDDAHARLAESDAEEELTELATECLMPASAARPQSAEAVAKAVHDYLSAVEQRVHDANARTLALKRTQKLGIALTAVIAAGLAVSLWFWRDADAQRQIAEQAASDAKTAEGLEKQARKDADMARDAAQANLANFNRLSHVVRLESAKTKERDLYPGWPSKSDAIRTWLDTDAKDLVGALPELRSTLAELEARALPQPGEDKAKERENHPRAGELKALEAKLNAMRRAQDVRKGTSNPEPLALDEAKFPKTHGELNNLAWALVDPERKEFGREAEGLALARRAVSAAPESGDDRAMVTDTLAWALFANGMDQEALTNSKAALAFVSEENQAEYAGYLTKLEAAIATASGDEGQRAITDLAEQVAVLDGETSSRTDWTFEDDADRFLHTTLHKLVADIEAFAEAEVAQIQKQLTWSERVKELTITRYDERWKEARLAIIAADGTTASKLYAAERFELSPQMGLVPLGMNPKTLLWEFYHLRSAWDGVSDPSAIPIPTHLEDGSIEVTADTGIVFVLLPGATFWMGAQATDPNGPNYDKQARPDEAPRQVNVPPFFLARHEMTQGQWARMWIGDGELRRPSSYGLDRRITGMATAVDGSHPVEHVDWTMSSETMDRHGLSLPTEAQWEYGCRGTTTTPYWFNFADLKDLANVADATARRAAAPWACEAWSDGHIIHAPAGTFGANMFGLHDVHGNVWEWCQDTIGSSSNHGSRGGSFSDLAVTARSATRTSNGPTIRSGILGLRPARIITE